jgi:hypothetical protein
MQLLYRKPPHSVGFGRNSPRSFLSQHSPLKLLCLAAALWLICGAISGRSHANPMSLRDFGPADLNRASIGTRLHAQISMGGAKVKFDVDGFNRKREKDIANDSRKLLSLALALKAELDDGPASRPSSDAVNKVGEIEKLARDVKRKMQIAPRPGPI